MSVKIFKLNLRLELIPTIYHFHSISTIRHNTAHCIFFPKHLARSAISAGINIHFCYYEVNNHTLEHFIIHSVGKNYKKLVFLYFFFFLLIEHVVWERARERCSYVEYWILLRENWLLTIIMTMFEHIHDFITKNIIFFLNVERTRRHNYFLISIIWTYILSINL